MISLVEAYDRAVVRRRDSKQQMLFVLTLIALLVAFYAVTIVVKGWSNDFLWGLVGFALLGLQAAMRYRDMRYWDQEIRYYLSNLHSNGRRAPL